VRITSAAARGTKLRPDKGINLPDSRLRLPAPTNTDLANLAFVVQHADADLFLRRGHRVAPDAGRLR
jgi:pyruvate kinase